MCVLYSTVYSTVGISEYAQAWMLPAIGIPDEPREKLSPKAVMEESASPMLEVENRNTGPAL
jgi:hypothetical protein